MNVTRDDAVEALETISKAGGKVQRLQGYHQGAPHFLVWGTVWLVANTVTQFWPSQGNVAWIGMLIFGFIASTVIGCFQSAAYRKSPRPGGMNPKVNSRIGITSLVYFGFIFCLAAITHPETSRQYNAMISVFFAFLYMAGGIWAGWRLFAIGLVTAVAIMVGFYWVKDYFDLWMAIFGGGLLIAGGIWLRTA